MGPETPRCDPGPQYYQVETGTWDSLSGTRDPGHQNFQVGHPEPGTPEVGR